MELPWSDSAQSVIILGTVTTTRYISLRSVTEAQAKLLQSLGGKLRETPLLHNNLAEILENYLMGKNPQCWAGRAGSKTRNPCYTHGFRPALSLVFDFVFFRKCVLTDKTL